SASKYHSVNQQPRFSTEMPPRVMETTMASTSASAYKISGRPMMLTPNTLNYLRSTLPDGESISKMVMSKDVQDKKINENEIPEAHEVFSHVHLLKIEKGGQVGLERIVGVILVTESHQFEVLCTEVYSSDTVEDPHAESHSAFPSSVPTNASSTQYKGELIITHLHDMANNRKLVIGVRNHNYLVTSGFHNETALVGLGRCSVFPMKAPESGSGRKDRTLGYTKGLAQVRSRFGHKTMLHTTSCCVARVRIRNTDA
ncbi:hypothetical protein BGZ65_011544, partial [Modicella reniformis]